MTKPLVCDNCGLALTPEMEIEYSEYLQEFFCHPDCAMDRYFKVMKSLVVDTSDETFWNNHFVELSDNGELFDTIEGTE